MQRRTFLPRLCTAALPVLLTLGVAVWSPPSGPPVTHADDSVVLAVIGDYGTNNSGAYNLSALVSSWQPDAVATVGDNIYVDAPELTGTDRFDLTVGNFFCPFLGGSTPAGPECTPDPTAPNRFFPATGNHDYEDGPIESYLDYFDLPGPGTVSRTPSGSELYYDVDLGAVHLFFIDSQAADNDPARPGVVPLATQRAWLEQALAASTAPWQMVLFHHPPYSSGGTWLNHTVMQWPFADWGADMVLSGHHHAYERLARDGIVYNVVGLGGAGRYLFGEPVEGSIVRYRDNEGALRLTADESSLVGEFFAVDGTLVDRYELTATVTEPPTTEPPTTEPPTTEPPTTEPPTTEPPTTEPPSTEPPTTEPPNTSNPSDGNTGGGAAGPGGGSGGPSGPGTGSQPLWERLGGTDRYATAVAVSRRVEPGVAMVSLVAGHSFADAVAAGAMADGPILLTHRDRLPDVVRQELLRLQPQSVQLIGGEQAITAAVEDQVRSTLRDTVVERIAGADRYATIAHVAMRRTTAVDTLWVASGDRFPDALVAAAGARSGGAGHGIVLTRPGQLPGTIATALERLAPRRIVIVGGDAAVSAEVAAQIVGITGAISVRIAGTDRRETAIAVAEWLRSDSLRAGGFASVNIATETDFADALSAVTLAGPLLYTSRDCLPAGVAEGLRRWVPQRIIVLGGEAAVGPGIPSGVSCG